MRKEFAIKWNDAKLDKDGKRNTVEIENCGCKISCIYGIKSFVKRDFDSHNVMQNFDDDH